MWNSGDKVPFAWRPSLPFDFVDDEVGLPFKGHCLEQHHQFYLEDKAV